MLIIEKSHPELKSFYDQFEQSLNNVYMCADMNTHPAGMEPVAYPKFLLAPEKLQIPQQQPRYYKKQVVNDSNNIKKNYSDRYIIQNMKKILHYKD